MVTEVITYAFCIAIAIGALFAWANAESKYKAQRNKIFELAAQLKYAHRDLRELRDKSGNTDSRSQRYYDALIKVGAIVGTDNTKSETNDKINTVLSAVIPEAVTISKQPKGKGKRDGTETEEMFRRMKEKLGGQS
ncbi:MAG: hypothetical protein OEZ43_09635 [Gammaproteobacteria bacterium]|nr:hypothetical protein [Gammaproteobacteria bacterium]